MLGLTPEMKLALYACYQKEHEKNPEVTIQDIWDMITAKYNATAATNEPATNAAAVTVGKPICDAAVPMAASKATHQPTTLPPPPPPHGSKSCDIMLDLIANHRKLRKPVK